MELSFPRRTKPADSTEASTDPCTSATVVIHRRTQPEHFTTGTGTERQREVSNKLHIVQKKENTVCFTAGKLELWILILHETSSKFVSITKDTRSLILG